MIGSLIASAPDFAQAQQAPTKPTGKPALRLKNPKNFSKKALITPLLKQLALAKDPQTGQALAQAVIKLWHHSKSPTVELLMSQAAIALKAKDIRKSLSLLDAIIEIEPGYVAGWNLRATAYFMARAYDASMADITKVLELEPRHFAALSGLGLVMQALGDKKGALNAFRRALAIHPHMQGPLQAVRRLTPEVEGRGI